MKHAAPLIDASPYYARCGGVVKRGTLAEVKAWAEHELSEWFALGYRRCASVFYRDGSLVEELAR